ncbi:tripartite tricarboxylate transporter substrate binding protein [Variovorax sp. J22P168]|uniref:Bug family tripartite tricarboxylate transporter substrate binding protein n=1 Tax=Variovorax jilinensis TaxID=3053513 RepID=UPI0025754883|nr:tripartite tricarboxylate transporter substrate binding protein [Variovorax sp. J22P168]MDM0015558.1 tripartite tricarboxylate transporter substrate binding protein [Variovorax sp. J22P168]
MRRRRLIQSLPLAFAGIQLLPLRAHGNGTFPDPAKVIRFIVPFPAGGTSDVRARQVAERMRQDTGWSIVIENRPGASGMIGSDLVAKAPADGYMLLLGTIGSLAINPAMFPNQPYDVLRDFQPVTQFSRSVTVLMAHQRTGFTTLAQLEDAVRTGARLAYASTGNGTIGHMVGELYKKRAGLDITHVPYKGTAPAVQDFVAGHVPLLYETPSAVWEHLKAGTAAPLAVTSASRMPQMPAVPTFRELGYGDVVFDTWQGVVTTKGVPPAVLDALNREMVKALRNPEVLRSHEEQVNVVVANTPEQFERFVAEETAKWGAVVKETGVTPG